LEKPEMKQIKGTKNSSTGSALILPRIHKPLYPELFSGEEGLQKFIHKAVRDKTIVQASDEEAATAQPTGIGLKDHPFDFGVTSNFKLFNSWHSACIDTKTNSNTGLGWKDPKIAKVLNPLCAPYTFLDVLRDLDEDFWQTGNALLEVRRNKGGKIVGLHHLPATTAYINVEDDRGIHFHWEVFQKEWTETDTLTSIGESTFARFGDKDGYIKRNEVKTAKEQNLISEVIHIRNPTSLSRWYGMPGWLASVVFIELTQALNQHEYDYYLNRAVPEFMLFVMGDTVGKKDWDALNTNMQNHIGYGNSRKSMALNIPGAEARVQLEKLGLSEQANDSYPGKMDALALGIVSAHQVPPLLAGIQIPGKLGATNELPNALMAFQLLVISPAQKLFAEAFANTLGNPKLNNGLELSESDFMEKNGTPKLKTIIEEYNLDTMDTVGRMKTPVTQANAEGRDPKDGLKD